jgi:hypothetical protein
MAAGLTDKGWDRAEIVALMDAGAILLRMMIFCSFICSFGPKGTTVTFAECAI